MNLSTEAVVFLDLLATALSNPVGRLRREFGNADSDVGDSLKPVANAERFFGDECETVRASLLGVPEFADVVVFDAPFQRLHQPTEWVGRFLDLGWVRFGVGQIR